MAPGFLDLPTGRRGWPPAARRGACGAGLGVLFFLCAVGAPLRSSADHERVRARSLTVEDGLAHDTVYTLLQDRVGFMWFGTEEGLDRYDGYGFKHVGRATRASAGLSAPDISAVLEDSDGTLWVGVWGGGLNRFDPNEMSFACFRHDPEDDSTLADDRIYTIIEDRDGRLWIATVNGLSRLNRKTSSFVRFRHDPADPLSLSSNRVWSVSQGPDGAVWVGTDAGLDRIDPVTERVRRFQPEPNRQGGLSAAPVRVVLHGRDGTLWVGTERGLSRFDPNRQAFESLARRQGTREGFSVDAINCLYEATDRALWVGTQRSGLYRFDREGGTFERVLTGTGYEIVHEVEAVTEDSSGEIWVATRGGGVRVINTDPSIFHTVGRRKGSAAGLLHRTVQAVWVDADRTIWAGTPRGLSRLDPAGGATHFTHDPSQRTSLAHAAVWAVVRDSGGNLWVGTDGGLDMLDETTGVFTHHVHDPGDATSLSNNRVLALLEDHEGRLWVGTRGGLNRLDRPGAGFVRYLGGEFGEGPLSDSFVRALAEDRSGRLWIGTEVGGVNVLDPESGTVRVYRHDPESSEGSISDDRIFSFWESSSGEMWVGTSFGLDRFDPGSGRWTVVHAPDGLPSETIHCLLGDGAGRLWIGSNGGLTRLNPDLGVARTYVADEGLQGALFSRGACFRGGDGTMYFGGLDGLSSFVPDEVGESSETPPVVVTDFSVFERPVDFGRALHAVDRIDLDYREHTFRIEFAALDFAASGPKRYSYRLEPMESEWSAPTSRRDVRYTNVQPGRYVFRVRAANRDGVWDEHGTSVEVVVAAPWWQTWWFRSSALALAVALLLGLHRARVGVVQRRNDRLERVVAERTAELQKLNETKSEFLGIAAHDLRSPLGVVTSYTDLLLGFLDQGKWDVEVWRRFLGNLRTTAEQMRRLVDELLDVTAIETGRLSLSLSRFEISALVEERARLLSQMAVSKDIRLTVEPDDGSTRVRGDRTRVGEVIDNLVANAIKFTHPGGRVRVWCEVGEEEVSVHVEDTGQGIETEELEHVFTGRKLSSRPTGDESSTGLGLVIVRKIVELHGGKLAVSSVRDEGSTFSFSLPLV